MWFKIFVKMKQIWTKNNIKEFLAKKKFILKILLFLILCLIYCILLIDPEKGKIKSDLFLNDSDLFKQKSGKIKILIFGKFIGQDLLPEFDYVKCPKSEFFEIVRSENYQDYDAVIMFHLEFPKFQEKFRISKKKKIFIMFLWVFFNIIGPSLYNGLCLWFK